MHKKNRPDGLLFIVNGGVDASRFELFKKFIFDLFTRESAKICSMIEKLGVTA